MKEAVRVPPVGESIVEGIITAWLKKEGEFVREGDDLFELETEKASVTVPSPFDGVLEILVAEGGKVEIGQVVAMIDTAKKEEESKEPAAAKAPVGPRPEEHGMKTRQERKAPPEMQLSPAVRRAADELDVDLSGIEGTGKGGRITKGDVLQAAGTPAEEKAGNTVKPDEASVTAKAGISAPGIKRAPMTSVRKSIAKRLVSARQEAAHLTTFNEINMENLMEMRKKHQETFRKKHGIKLGIMSFFVKASIEALKEFPVINARIEGDDIVYYDFYDIGVAVSTERGLLVPVIRNADVLGFAEIEKKIADLSDRAREKKITLQELQGGTFSITNGGIFGSLMSTPIPNYPQPAILGMHAVKDRPVAVQGEVKIKPMMYVALTYDHRLIDGREAVSFLVRIKEYIEDPEKILLYI